MLKTLLFCLIVFGLFVQHAISEQYVFGGLGGVSCCSDLITHLGYGAEGRIYKQFKLGGEIGYLTPVKAFGDGLGVFSFNGSYEFPKPKWSPFITGGYTLFFRESSASLFNFGGGVTYMNGRTGVRLEFRDHVYSDYGTEHWYGFRVALVFR